MKKVKAWWGVGREMDEDVLEFADDATDEEIEEAVREYVMAISIGAGRKYKMAKNLMPEIIKMLGVEYGEKFKLRAEDSEICENALFYFDKDNGFIRMSDTKEEVYNMLYDVVSGYYEIVKLPWEPKYKEDYYSPSISKRSVIELLWLDDTRDYAMKNLGMIYRTKAEAEKHLAEDYERLTGKKLEK